ncbi:MAG: hypothetical protein LUD72_14090 [Bacteroidales bacterium]|nr:hypothetical protein [Bacteroidales bacterium]
MVKSLFNTRAGICYECHECGNIALHHIFPGNPRRRFCTEDGLIVFLCTDCHRKVHENPNTGIDLDLKQAGQRLWETYYGDRSDFIKRYNKNYLDE